jgi:hypothetical protein
LSRDQDSDNPFSHSIYLLGSSLFEPLQVGANPASFPSDEFHVKGEAILTMNRTGKFSAQFRFHGRYTRIRSVFTEEALSVRLFAPVWRRKRTDVIIMPLRGG